MSLREIQMSGASACRLLEVSAVENLGLEQRTAPHARCMRASVLMLLRVSSAVALLPVASRVGVKSLPAIARRGKGIASLVAPQSPASVLFPRLARRSMTVRACMSPEEVAAAVDAQANEVRRLKDQGLGNKSPEVSAAVTELLRLKALLPPEQP
jgi:hypothetical protein